MTTAQQNASPGVYVSDDVGLEVTDGFQSRVQMGLLPVGVNKYGIRVVSSDGTTVIIDGTSDMFRIQTTGTCSKATVVGDMGVTTVVTLPGLGSLPTTPAHQCYLSTGNATNSDQHLGTLHYGSFGPGLGFVAPTSAGSPTNKMVATASLAEIHVHISASVVEVILAVFNQTGSYTVYGRYYVLAQAAL